MLPSPLRPEDALPTARIVLPFPPMATPSQLVGRTVSHYRIIEKIGGEAWSGLLTTRPAAKSHSQLPCAAVHKLTHAS